MDKKDEELRLTAEYAAVLHSKQMNYTFADILFEVEEGYKKVSSLFTLNIESMLNAKDCWGFQRDNLLIAALPTT